MEMKVDLREDIRLEEIGTALGNQWPRLLREGLRLFPARVGRAARIQQFRGELLHTAELHSAQPVQRLDISVDERQQQTPRRRVVEVIRRGGIFRVAVTSGGLEVSLITFLDRWRGALAKFLAAPSVNIRVAFIRARRDPRLRIPRQLHHRPRGHRHWPHVRGVYEQPARGAHFRGAAQLPLNARQRHHFAVVVGHVIVHGGVIILALFGGDGAFVLQDSVAIVRPDQRDAVGDFQRALMDEGRRFAPRIHEQLRMRIAAAHNLDLLVDGSANYGRASLVGGGRVRIVLPERVVILAAKAHAPQDLGSRRIFAGRAGPRRFQRLWIGQPRHGLVLRPAISVQPECVHVVLRHDEAALASSLDLRLIRKDPRARHYHVALEPQDGLEDVIPQLQRNSCTFLYARLPSRKQVLVVEEPAAIVEPRGFREREVAGDLDFGVVRGSVIRPPVERVHSEELLRELVNSVDCPAHIRTRQHNGLAVRRGDRLNMQRLPSRGVRDLAGRVLLERDPDGHRPCFSDAVHDFRTMPEDFLEVRSEIHGRLLQRAGLPRVDQNRACAIHADIGERGHGKQRCRQQQRGYGPVERKSHRGLLNHKTSPMAGVPFFGGDLPNLRRQAA